MKHVVLWMFAFIVIGLLFSVGRYLLLEHRKMYGTCWKHVVNTAKNLVKHSRDRQMHLERIDEIAMSTGFVKNFTDTYVGLIDLDLPFTMINPEWEYFKLLRIKLRNKVGFNSPIYMELLERAIFHYNIDLDYTITTRQLIAYVNHIFDEYYVKPIKEMSRWIEGGNPLFLYAMILKLQGHIYADV